MKKVKKRGGPEQAAFVFRSWGGRRVGAGRPRRSKQSVPHGVRPKHSRHHPLHITLRVREGAPNLRSKLAYRVIKKALGLANARGKHHEHFRITHYSVQSNHMHLVAEASDRERLAPHARLSATRFTSLHVASRRFTNSADSSSAAVAPVKLDSAAIARRSFQLDSAVIRAVNGVRRPMRHFLRARTAGFPAPAAVVWRS